MNDQAATIRRQLIDLLVQGPFGVAYDPLSGRWGRSSDCDINYMMTVTRDAA